MMTWKADAHSDEENMRWCSLRAIEWGAWPVFVSQPIVPILLIMTQWKALILALAVINLLWAFTVRYAVVSPAAATVGVFFVRIKWITGPAAALYLYGIGQTVPAALALFWPLVAMVLGPVTALGTEIGRIQTMFMRALGYQEEMA